MVGIESHRAKMKNNIGQWTISNNIVGSWHTFTAEAKHGSHSAKVVDAPTSEIPSNT